MPEVVVDRVNALNDRSVVQNHAFRLLDALHDPQSGFDELERHVAENPTLPDADADEAQQQHHDVLVIVVLGLKDSHYPFHIKVQRNQPQPHRLHDYTLQNL